MDRQTYDQQRYQANKQMYKDKAKAWHEANPEKALAKNRAWRAKNHRKVLTNRWIQRGLKVQEGQTIDEIYDRWVSATNCELCDKDITTGRQKMMDHDHTSGLFRNIVCCRCNTIRDYPKK